MEVGVAGDMEDGVQECVGPVTFSGTAPAPGRPGASRHCGVHDEDEDEPPVAAGVLVVVMVI